MCLNLRPQLNQMLHYTRIDRPSEVGVLVGHRPGFLAQGVEHVLSKTGREGDRVGWGDEDGNVSVMLSLQVVSAENER
jgi:hypothetical protein